MGSNQNHTTERQGICIMSAKKILTARLYCFLILFLWAQGPLAAEEVKSSPLSLQQLVQIALEANLDVKTSNKEAEAAKLLDVSKETVNQVSVQTDVVNNFYQVGMSPLNDLLESQVLLASATQEVVRTRSNLDIAKASLYREMGQDSFE